MTTTSHLNITLIETAQAQKEVTVNEALSVLDALMNTGVADKDLNTPPGSPVSGDVYIVASTPTGDWVGHANHLAYFDQIWKFITPNEGLTFWVNDENKHYYFDGASWQVLGAGRHQIYVPATLIRPNASGGSAALASTAVGSGQPDMHHLAFDQSIQEYAQFSICLPKRWNIGGGTAIFEWSHAATTTNFGVVWNIQVLAFSDGDSLATSFSTATSVTDTGGATNTLYKSPESGFFSIFNSPAAADTLYFRISRDATNGADTLAIDARLHGVMLSFYTNAITDD